MKKILFVTNYPSPYRTDFFNQLGKSVKLTAAITNKPEDQNDRARIWFSSSFENFHAVFLGDKQETGCLSKPVHLIRLLKQKFDIIIFGGYSSPVFMIAMEYLRLHKIPYYIEADGGIIRSDSKIKFLIKKHFIGSASGWLSSGRLTTDYFLHYGAKKEYVYQYPFTSLLEADMRNALPEIHIENWTAERTEIKNSSRKKLKIKEEFMVLYVGQFIYRKGLDILIKAAGKIDKKIGVYIVGGKPDKEYIKLVKSEKAVNVHFVGFKEKSALAEYYRAADVFAMPTREDIWGLVINEALSYGLPIVSTDKCVAALELIKDGKNGYIVPVDNSKALSEKIMKILKTDYNNFSLAAYQSIQKYTIENMTKRHLEVFQEILKGNSKIIAPRPSQNSSRVNWWSNKRK